MTPNRLILLVALWITATADHGFWSLFIATHGLTTATWLFAGSLAIAITALNVIVLSILAPGRTLRPMLSTLLVVCAVTSWFVDTYGVSINYDMVRNVAQTNVSEARDFIGWSLLWRVLWQAGLPIAYLWIVKLPRSTLRASFKQYALTPVISLLVLLVVALPLYVSYASFFRNQTAAEHLIVPGNLIRATGQLTIKQLMANTPYEQVGVDAKRTVNINERTRPLLTVLVVGETARADDFSLGGYARTTNPLLAQRKVLYFANVYSCGTATAISVPCMFSDLPRSEFKLAKAEFRDNVLDVLQRSGLDMDWVDNQAGCKGVCKRIPHEQTNSNDPSLCAEGECLDEMLLHVLQQKLTTVTTDSVLVLHQMGSHGPAYFRRIPYGHALFTPTCDTGRIETCTKQQIVNTYDNTIAYTDLVLAHVIDELQRRQNELDSVLIYVSDHGESLGENGLYLHGEPYSIAPDVQKHIPMLMWFSADTPNRLHLDLTCMQRKQQQALSHDNLSHTLLGLNDVNTSIYRPELDLLHDCRSQS